MNQVDHQKKHLSVSKTNLFHSRRMWRNVLLTCGAVFVLMVLTQMLLGPWLIDYADVKPKIQEAVKDNTGGQIDFQKIGISYWPRPGIKLRQITLTLSDRTEASVGALHLSPKFLALLGGDLRLARVELDEPQLTLNLPEQKPKKAEAPLYTYDALQKTLSEAIAAFGEMIAVPKLQIDDARISISKNGNNLLEIEGLDLQGGISLTGSNRAGASLQAKLALLTLFANDQKTVAENLNLRCSGGMMADRMTVKLEQLSLSKPQLSLGGNFNLTPNSPALTLNLSGNDIDVEAVREAALALAGDTTPVKEIFDYLRGGRAPQITFTSSGENWSELGEFNNMQIKGHLQDGMISIPDIKLDLSQVIGDVIIREGVLQGSKVSARLNKSTGRDGSLQIGLAEDQDVFKLQLTLNADLADTHAILRRVIDDSAIKTELAKIENVQGRGHGTLILGDSFNDIRAKIDIREFDLAADYQRIPLPIAITQGQIALDDTRLELHQLRGTVGKSTVENFSSKVSWADELFLDIGSGRFDLNMAELYPWLAAMEGLGEQLQKVRNMSGRLQLSDLAFKGEVDKPAEWQFSTSGTVKNLSAETDLFTEAVQFTEGAFKIDNEQLNVEKLHAVVLDTDVTATGIAGGLPDQIDRVELMLEGRLGADTVTEISETFEVLEPYRTRSPLEMKHAQVLWQPDSTFSFKGNVTVEQGPMLTADISYLPGQLQINGLDIKDQYSDASILLDHTSNARRFKFTGTLQHETLENIFVNPLVAGGWLKGDFSVTIPGTGQDRAVTTGHLRGENLLLPLSTGDTIDISRITLQSDGTDVQVDIPKLKWRGLVWEPIRGDVSFSSDTADFKIADARLCDINTHGMVSYNGDAFSADMSLEGKDLDVETSYTCLTEGRVKATGRLDFSSRLSTRGKTVELLGGLDGPVKMTFRDGVIEQSKVVARTLEILNVTEIFKGKLPNLNSTGLAYETITLQSEFDKGVLVIDKASMVGETLDLVGTGKINVEENTIEGQLLAAPLKTVDTVVKYIPGLNYLLGGSLIAIPISVEGSLDDPQVQILSASAISSSLYNMAERIIKSPVRLFETIIPSEENN